MSQLQSPALLFRLIKMRRCASANKKVTPAGIFFASPRSIAFKMRVTSLMPTPHRFELGRMYSARSRTRFQVPTSGRPPEQAALQACPSQQKTIPVFKEDVSPANFVFHLGAATGGFWIDDVRFYEGDYVPTIVGR